MWNLKGVNMISRKLQEIEIQEHGIPMLSQCSTVAFCEEGRPELQQSEKKKVFKMQRTSCALVIILLTFQFPKIENILVFPPTAPTRIQLICGIGFPVEELLFESVTFGYVLKAEYFLPETAEQLRTKNQLPINGRRKRFANMLEQHLVDKHNLYPNQTFWDMLEKNRNVLSSYRWALYKALEGFMQRSGYPGRACMLKSICEAAEVPFHYWNGLFGELFHVLLTPSSSMDELSSYSDNEYFHAEALGRSGAECHRVFSDCKRSLLDHLSEVESFPDNMMELFI